MIASLIIQCSILPSWINKSESLPVKQVQLCLRVAHKYKDLAFQIIKNIYAVIVGDILAKKINQDKIL